MPDRPPDRAGVTAEHPAQRSTIAVAITPRARSTKLRGFAELVSPAQVRTAGPRCSPDPRPFEAMPGD